MGWKKGLRYLRSLITLNDTPERIAMGFAVGIFLAFTPLLGLHTFLGLLAAFLFGLNRVAVLVGVFVNNPWTLVPIYGLATYLGGLLLGFPASAALPELDWGALFEARFWAGLVRDWRVLKPLFLGSTVLAFAAATLSYFLLRHFIRKARLARAAAGSLPA